MSLAPPQAPVVGVGGVAILDGKVVLIRRGKPPMEGRWTIPGGTVELGETLVEALVREMLEETGLQVEPDGLLTVFDRVAREGGRVQYHYVIADYLCHVRGGEPRAGSDARELALAAEDELEGFELPEKALEVVREGFARWREAGRAG